MNFKIATLQKLTSVLLLFLSFHYKVNAEDTIESFAKQQPYLKFGTGLNMITPVKLTNDDYKGKLKLVNNFPLIEAGLGFK